MADASDAPADAAPAKPAVAPPQKLADVAAGKLSVLGRTADGLGHAYIQLDITNCNVNSLEGLERFPHLRHLILTRNLLKDDSLAQLSALKYLLTVDLAYNQLQSVLGKNDPLPSLQALDLSYNKLAKRLPDVKHTALRSLNLNFNQITQLGDALNALADLQLLELRGNKLTKASGFASCSSLTELYIAQNALTSFQGMGAVPKLQRLHARANKLTSLQGLEEQAALVELNVRDNALDTFDALTPLVPLRFLRKLVLTGNPVADLDNYRVEVVLRLPQLTELDKAPVSADERQEAAELKAERERAAAEAAAAAAADAAGGDEE